MRLIRDEEKGGKGVWRWGERESIYTYRYTVTTRMTSALRWAAMMDKVTRQCPQTTIFEEKGEPKRYRTEVLLLTSLTPYR